MFGAQVFKGIHITMINFFQSETYKTKCFRTGTEISTKKRFNSQFYFWGKFGCVNAFYNSCLKPFDEI